MNRRQIFNIKNLSLGSVQIGTFLSYKYSFCRLTHGADFADIVDGISKITKTAGAIIATVYIKKV
jgi:hypothetical protein